MARGIGAAIQGFFGGYGYGEDLKDRRRGRERQDRLDEIAEEQRQIDNRIRSEQQSWARANHEWQQGLNQRQQEMWNAYAKAADIAANRSAPSAGAGTVNRDPATKVLDIIANESGPPGRPQARPLRGASPPGRPEARPDQTTTIASPGVAPSTIPMPSIGPDSGPAVAPPTPMPTTSYAAIARTEAEAHFGAERIASDPAIAHAAETWALNRERDLARRAQAGVREVSRAPTPQAPAEAIRPVGRFDGAQPVVSGHDPGQPVPPDVQIGQPAFPEAQGAPVVPSAAPALPDIARDPAARVQPRVTAIPGEQEDALRSWMAAQAGQRSSARGISSEATVAPPVQPAPQVDQHLTGRPTRERPVRPDPVPQLLGLTSRPDRPPTRGISRQPDDDTQKVGGRSRKGSEKQATYGLQPSDPPLVPQSPLERDGPTDAYGLRPSDPPLVPRPPTEQRVERETGETQEQEETAQALEATGLPSAQALAEAAAGKDAPRTRAEAERASEDFMTAYRREGAPYLEQQLLRLGMIDQVAEFRSWMDSEATRAGMEAYGNAAFAAARGDMDSFADAVVSLYNNNDYFPNDLTVDRSASQFITNEDGDILGAEIAFEDARGNRFIETWEGMEELVEDILNLTSPERAFEMQLARAEAAIEAMTQADQQQRAQIEAMRKRVSEIVESLTDPMAGGDADAWAEASSDERIDMILQRLGEEDAVVMEALGFTAGSDAEAPALPGIQRFNLD